MLFALFIVVLFFIWLLIDLCGDILLFLYNAIILSPALIVFTVLLKHWDAGHILLAIAVSLLLVPALWLFKFLKLPGD